MPDADSFYADAQTNEPRAKGRVRSNMKNKRTSLDDYVEFLNSNKSMELPCRDLYQINTIFGYKLPKATTKKTLIDAISRLDLKDPFRSTLRDSNRIPPSATEASLQDVIADLKALEWQECCVASIENLKAEKETSPSASGVFSALKVLREPKLKRKHSGEDKIVKLPSGIYDEKKKMMMETLAESGGGGGGNENDKPSS